MIGWVLPILSMLLLFLMVALALRGFVLAIGQHSLLGLWLTYLGFVQTRLRIFNVHPE